MSDGTQTLTMAEALAQARTELGEATPDAAETAMPAEEANVPASVEQAQSDEGEQPAADTNGQGDAADDELVAALMDTGVDSQNGSGPGLVPGSDDFWNHSVQVQTVAGPQTVTIRELTDGFLRQADYTQKTQALADQRKSVEESVEFHDAFKKNPDAFIRSLAAQAGLIDASTGPIEDLPITKIPTQEEIDARLEEMVNERVSNDPRVKSAEMVDAQSRIDEEFVRLEGVYNMELPKNLRDSIVDEAIKSGNADLEGILAKRMVRAQSKSGVEGRLPASSARPGSPPTEATQPEGTPTTGKPSMREAWQQAKVELAQQ